MNKAAEYTVKPFGSGWAVYENGFRITCALDESVAEEKKVVKEMEAIGFDIVYNPEKKTVKQLLQHFKQWNSNAAIIRHNFGKNRILDFVGIKKYKTLVEMLCDFV